MENVIFLEKLEMLNKIIDGPDLKTSSMWFATNEYAKYQDFKESNKKMEQVHLEGWKFPFQMLQKRFWPR